MLPQTPDIIPTTLNQVSENDSNITLGLFYSFRVVTFNLKVSACFDTVSVFLLTMAKRERSVSVTRETLYLSLFQEISYAWNTFEFLLYYLFFCVSFVS